MGGGVFRAWWLAPVAMACDLTIWLYFMTTAETKSWAQSSRMVRASRRLRLKVHTLSPGWGGVGGGGVVYAICPVCLFVCVCCAVLCCAVM